jgi:hypothetical protein
MKKKIENCITNEEKKILKRMEFKIVDGRNVSVFDKQGKVFHYEEIQGSKAMKQFEKHEYNFFPTILKKIIVDKND